MAVESDITSPDGRIKVSITDDDGLRYRVDFNGKPVVVDSRLGIEFKDSRVVTPADVLDLKLESAGGFAAVLSPR